jgi:hypothetical protein
MLVPCCTDLCVASLEFGKLNNYFPADFPQRIPMFLYSDIDVLGLVSGSVNMIVIYVS